jgi:putative DNA primase/helicase
MPTKSHPPFSHLPPPAAGARRAVQFDFPIVPLKPRSKIPAVRHGIDDAITTRIGVRTRAKARPDDNYGAVLNGEVFVIDVDGLEGAASLQALMARHGELPPTVETITPRGRHLWYRSRPGHRREGPPRLCGPARQRTRVGPVVPVCPGSCSRRDRDR